jgi:hypothetical protein
MRVKRNFIQPGMPFEHYRGIAACNASSLKNLLHSPQQYRHRLAQPLKKAALTFGSAAHCATLEPARFETDYVVWNRRTETGRNAPRTGKAWEQFVAEVGDSEILTEDEAIAPSAIARAVRSDPVASTYLAAGEPEVTMVWHLGKRACKGRVDWLTEIDRQPVIVGLKTARDCRLREFQAASIRLGYDIQWAWYADGYNAITKKTPRLVEIVVDSEAPHSVVTYAIDDVMLDFGRDRYQALLERLTLAEKEDHWPGPAETEVVLTPPAWAWPDSEEDVGGGESLDWEGMTT